MNFKCLPSAFCLFYLFSCAHAPKPAPAKSAGISGFRLQQMDQGSPLAKLGLKANDIIEEINGRKMDSLSAAQQMLSQLENQDRAEIKVIRDGKPLTLHYNIK